MENTQDIELIDFADSISTFDPETGYKTYPEKFMCDFAIQAQRKAHKLNCAPKVIKRINDFCYQTEVADTSFFMQNLAPAVYYNAIFPDLHKKLVPIFKNSPYKNGPDGVDLARHNLGLLDGKVVMIDFY